MIKYRVALRVGYFDAWFDFDNVEDAGAFAKTALMHNTPNEDTVHEFEGIKIEVINTNKDNKESEETE